MGTERDVRGAVGKRVGRGRDRRGLLRRNGATRDRGPGIESGGSDALFVRSARARAADQETLYHRLAHGTEEKQNDMHCVRMYGNVSARPAIDARSPAERVGGGDSRQPW